MHSCGKTYAKFCEGSSSMWGSGLIRPLCWVLLVLWGLDWTAPMVVRVWISGTSKNSRYGADWLILHTLMSGNISFSDLVPEYVHLCLLRLLACFSWSHELPNSKKQVGLSFTLPTAIPLSTVHSARSSLTFLHAHPKSHLRHLPRYCGNVCSDLQSHNYSVLILL